MRRAAPLLVLAVAIAAGTGRADADPINAVLGDQSWVATHGPASDPRHATELVRITTHLRYVQARLAQVAPPPGLRGLRRMSSLAELARYTERGEFPRRTRDAFGDRRPRFIDDRGVHCAVGELIARSGHPDLSRAIDRDLEYAYVRDMAVPALATWADTHGFTIDELAMIQPRYGHVRPPTKDDAIRKVDDDATSYAITCSKTHRWRPHARLRLTGDTRGRMTATTPDDDGFSRCVAAQASKEDPLGRMFRGSAKAYSVDRTLTFPTMQETMDRTLGVLDVAVDCAPRPGPLVRAVKVTVTTRADANDVSASTTPHNAEIERCATERVRNLLAAHGLVGIPGLRAELEVPITPRLNRLETDLVRGGYGSTHVLACQLTHPVSNDVTLRVRAARATDAVTITVAGGSPELERCVRDRITGWLREHYGVYRQIGGESDPRYFRVDEDVDASVVVRPRRK